MYNAKYYYRQRSSPDIYGPSTLYDIQEQLLAGHVTHDYEAMMATGQSYRQLRCATGWTTIGALIRNDPKDGTSGRNGSARPPPKVSAPTFIIFSCVQCKARIRVATTNIGADNSRFTCGLCKTPYSIASAQSDGIAYVILPCVTQSSPGRTHETEPEVPADVKSALHLFGLPHRPNDDALKGAYRDLMGKYHPDKVHHLGDELKKVAELKSKEINAAYGLLREYYGL